MKKRSFFALILWSLLLFSFGTSAYANAATATGPTTLTIPNPVRFETISEFFDALINLLISLGLALLVFMVVVAALYIMVGGNNQEYIQKGKNIIKWTVLGVFIVVAARAILWLVAYIFS